MKRFVIPAFACLAGSLIASCGSGTPGSEPVPQNSTEQQLAMRPYSKEWIMDRCIPARDTFEAHFDTTSLTRADQVFIEKLARLSTAFRSNEDCYFYDFEDRGKHYRFSILQVRHSAQALYFATAATGSDSLLSIEYAGGHRHDTSCFGDESSSEGIGRRTSDSTFIFETISASSYWDEGYTDKSASTESFTIVWTGHITRRHVSRADTKIKGD